MGIEPREKCALFAITILEPFSKPFIICFTLNWHNCHYLNALIFLNRTFLSYVPIKIALIFILVPTNAT